MINFKIVHLITQLLFLIFEAFNLIVEMFYFCGQGNIFSTFKFSLLCAPIKSFLFEPTVFCFFQTFTLLFFTIFLVFHPLNELDLLFLIFFFRLFILKVVFTTIFLVCLLSLKESTYEIWRKKNYFASKALFFLEKCKFQYFRYSNLMTSSIP